jgi:serine/threonine protein kinase
LIGQVLDNKYCIEKLLGQGGMGSVYLASHLGTGRPVALKIIAPQFMANEEFVARFRREAKAAGLLRHPNIVNVTDFGFANCDLGRIAYLVMEYLDGCTLADVLKLESRLPLNWIIDIIEQVCLAIDRAHKQGIIHRDLKPDNIWLEPNERGGFTVKVLDFGLAKLAGNVTVAAGNSREQFNQTSKSGNPPVNDSSGKSQVTSVQPPEEFTEGATHIQVSHAPIEKPDDYKLEKNSMQLSDSNAHELLTQVGTVLGTPLYMSPEQCRSRQLDERSDIYSLGVILYQLLAGEPPFTGSLDKLLKDHINTPAPPLKSRRADIPSQINDLVMSALAKDPALRPATAASFASSLQARAEGTGSLLRKCLSLYGQYFPAFFRISLVSHLPLIVFLLLFFLINTLFEPNKLNPAGFMKVNVVLGVLTSFAQIFAALTNSAAIVAIVVQPLVMPLRPIELGIAFNKLFARVRALLSASLIFYLKILPLLFLLVIPNLFHLKLLEIIFAAFGVKMEVILRHNGMEYPLLWRVLIAAAMLLLALPGIIAYVRNALYPAVIMMEDITGRAALRRSRKLVSGSMRTAVNILLFYIIVAVLMYALGSYFEKQFFSESDETVKSGEKATEESTKVNTDSKDSVSFTFSAFSSNGFTLAFNLLFNPIIGIVFALLYFKARRSGGETFQQILGSYSSDSLVAGDWQALVKEQTSRNTFFHITEKR